MFIYKSSPRMKYYFSILFLSSILMLLIACHASDKQNNEKDDNTMNQKSSKKDTIHHIRTVRDSARSIDTIPTSKPDSTQKMPVVHVDSLNRYL